MKSTPGYAYILNVDVISWSRKKQNYISLSMLEAEYITCCPAAQEVVWLRQFLKQSLIKGASQPVLI